MATGNPPQTILKNEKKPPTLLLQTSHDLNISEVLQLVSHGDGIVLQLRGAQFTVY